MASTALLAQQSGVTPDGEARDMARRLEQARQNNGIESARTAAEKANDTGALDGAAARARALNERPQPFAEKAMTKAADARMDQALKNVSPEGKQILAQNAVPALRAPEGESPASKPAAAAPSGDASAKRPTKGEDGGKGGAPAKDTKIVITAQGAAYFDSKESMAVFTDDVVVVHPQFTMNCDELEVYMKKEKAADKKPADGAGPDAKDGDAKAPAAADPTDAGGIDKAIGKGRKVVIQKADENGEPQIGICRHCTYDGPTGDVTLRDYPQVQRGRNVIIATAPTTYMVLKASGELKTYGPNKVDIIQEAKKAPAPQAVAQPQNPNAPTAPAKAKGGQQ